LEQDLVSKCNKRKQKHEYDQKRKLGATFEKSVKEKGDASEEQSEYNPQNFEFLHCS